MHSTLVKIGDRFDLDDWGSADPISKQVFFWLPELSYKTGNTHCILNLAWPNVQTITKTPLGYDTYIISFHLEYADYAWIKKFKKHVGDARVILINQFATLPDDLQNQIQLITYDIWPLVLEIYQQNNTLIDPCHSNRTIKASALANRVCQARAYVCAYLHQTWESTDYIMSWRKGIINENDLFLFDKTGNHRVDAVIDYLKSTFYNLNLIPSNQQTFTNTPFANLSYNWSAYKDCVVNFTNESVNCSHQFIDNKDCILPGPYFSEKTMKCLLSGTAMVPVGQYNSYCYLENMGFVFDYPWDKSFDKQPQDMLRFSGLFDVIDKIQQMDLEYIKQHTASSNQHNYNHIRSGGYKKQTLTNLKKNLEKFIDEN